MIDALAHDHAGTAATVAPLAILHTTLMVHGGWRMYRERDDFRAPQNAMLWLGGTAFVTNAVVWSSQLGERHGREFGVAETAVNAPLAAGLGYLAYDRLNNLRPSGFVYGGIAAISVGFAIHGLRTVIAPSPPLIDVPGLDLSPTVVSDGIEMAPGLGTAGTW